MGSTWNTLAFAFIFGTSAAGRAARKSWTKTHVAFRLTQFTMSMLGGKARLYFLSYLYFINI